MYNGNARARVADFGQVELVAVVHHPGLSRGRSRDAVACRCWRRGSCGPNATNAHVCVCPET